MFFPGILSVSRALGDHAMKQFVISKPFVLETVLRDTDSHLIVCCDGVGHFLKFAQLFLFLTGLGCVE